MRLQRLGAAVLALSFTTAAFADASSHEAATKRFFAVSEMQKLIDASLEQMTDMQIKANPALETHRATLLAFFRKHMGWQSLEGDLAKLYMKEFTEGEIAEITKFYETPIGQKVMHKLPALSAKGAELGQERIQSNIAELQAMLAADKAPEAKPAAQ